MGTYLALSGFVDRQTFLELTDMELKRCRRYHYFFSLLLLDLRTLSSAHPRRHEPWPAPAARLIRERVREADLVGAFPSGLVCVLLPHATGVEALDIRDRLVDWVWDCLGPATPRPAVGVPTGVAVYPSRAVTVEDLFAEAIQTLGLRPK